jgi:hypothetical protein
LIIAPPKAPILIGETDKQTKGISVGVIDSSYNAYP